MSRSLLRHWRLLLVCATLIAVALAIRSLTHALRDMPSPVSLGIQSSDTIDLTPAQVTSIRKIGRWEFLSLQMEEIVDTTHSRLLLPDEELVRIYRGTIRLGVDMSSLPDNWFQARGDTAIVRLPPIRQLNARFIDEARTQTFYESGTWSGRDRERLYRRARQRMLRRLRTSDAYRQAERNGREQVAALMRSFGFQTVIVSFGEQ